MDIHRCRFVPFPTSAINAVAFTHATLPTGSKKRREKVSEAGGYQVRLAIGRANGDIEIWDPADGAWHQELIIPGGKDRSIDGLVWITDPDEETADGKLILGRSRLFSIGYTAAVTEWDLEKARARQHASGQHGDIWCFAAQPLAEHEPSATRRLVAGTVDGSLVAYSTEDDELRFQKVIVRTASKKVKMVSIAFQMRSRVVVGCSDSTIRTYDINKGTLLRQMTLGSDLYGGSKDIIVWSLKCLPNRDIISGDSTGHVCIWDGKTYTQVQQIQSHKQDVLCLGITADGSKIISGGMDRRTVIYQPSSHHKGRWTKVWHRRYHHHDVKTMASFEHKGLSFMVTGGPDGSPVIFPIRTAGKEYHRNLSHLPQTTAISSASRARFVVSWWEREIHLWQLLKPATDLMDGTEVDAEDIEKNRKLLGRILIKGDSNITSASINEDGTLLVASTRSEIKAFQLHRQHGTPKRELKIKSVNVFGANDGATKVLISPTNEWVSWVEGGGNVVLAKINTSETGDGDAYSITRLGKLKRIRRKIHKNLLLGRLGSYDRNVTQLVFSPDGKMLAAADLAGYIDTWVLRGSREQVNGASGKDDDEAGSESSDESEDDEPQDPTSGWIRNPRAELIPKLDAAPVVLSFSNQTPGSESGGGGDDDYSLLVITNSWQVLLFNPLTGALSDWSRRNPTVKLPEVFRATRDLVKGVLWQGPRAWLYGTSFLAMLDLSQDFPLEGTPAESDGAEKKKQGVKRKRAENAGAGDKVKEPTLEPKVVKMLKTDADGSGRWVEVDMADAPKEEDSDLDEDDDDVVGAELQLLRDAQAAEESAANGDAAVTTAQRPSWWHTYKYRPILGVVPLWSEGQNEGHADPNDLPALEVALVERPIWDSDLPERYEAGRK